MALGVAIPRHRAGKGGVKTEVEPPAKKQPPGEFTWKKKTFRLNFSKKKNFKREGKKRRK